MTEQPLLPPPNEPPESVVVATKTPGRDLVPWFGGAGFLLLAAAIFYVWQYPTVPDETVRNASATQLLEQRLAAVDARLGRLEQRPTPDLGKISARVDVLEGRIADQTQLGSRLDTLSGRIESLSGRDQTALDATKQRLDGLTSRIAALESNAGGLDSVTKRLNRVAKLQEASIALAAGRPVGDLPNAPEALARYAHTAPPTEAQLRVEFAKAQKGALAAKQPNNSDLPFIGRVWDRAQGMITIRQGDDLVVGNTSAIILNQAQAALDLGDLPAAVQAVETLKGEPGQAMADWLAEAKALLSARSALANMTDQA
jgi:hypothetical protein